MLLNSISWKSMLSLDMKKDRSPNLSGSDFDLFSYGADVHNGFDYKVLKYRQKYTLSAVCTLVNWSFPS